MRHGRDHGFTMIEAVVSMALLMVAVGLALTLLGKQQTANVRLVPDTERVATRAHAQAELAQAIEDSSRGLTYLDFGATIAPVLEAEEGSAPASRPGSGGPPGGVGWGGSTPSEPGPIPVRPVVSYGQGVRVGQLPILGPVAVSDAEHPLFADQVGSAVTVLQSASGVAAFRLGQTVASGSGRIRLVGSDAASLEAIAGLRAGDVLAVVGRTPGGPVVSALAQLRSAPIWC